MDINSFQCDYCNEEPINGTRWHCTTCKEWSVDFCSDCLITQAQSKSHHPLDHRFIGFRVAIDFRTQTDEESGAEDEAEDDPQFDDFKDNYDDQIFDKDYFPINDKANYLDPNFLPDQN